jgi:hypothetical protein
MLKDWDRQKGEITSSHSLEVNLFRIDEETLINKQLSDLLIKKEIVSKLKEEVKGDQDE